MRTFQLLILSLLLLLQVHSQRPPNNNNDNSRYCPSSCNAATGNGQCSSSQRQCICNEGYFETDCSQQIIKLRNGVSQTLTINPDSWGYLYVSLDAIPGDTVLTFQSSQASLEYSLLLDAVNEFYLPNKYYTPIITNLLDESQISQTITIRSNILNLANGGALLIGAGNNDATNTVTLTVTNTWSNSSSGADSTTSNNFVMIIAISIGIAAFLLVFVIGAYTCRKRRQMRQQLQRMNQGQGQEQVQVQGQNIQQNPQQNPSNFLKKEDLDGYFPIRTFKDIKKSFDQTSCSICLEEYNPKAVCRQLYCEHVFHGACIEAWLAKHTECPNCKCQMTKTAIKEYKKKLKAEKKVQGQAQAETLTINQSSNKQDASVIIEIPAENIANVPVREAGHIEMPARDIESMEIPVRQNSRHAQ